MLKIGLFIFALSVALAPVHAQNIQCQAGENVSFLLLTSHRLDKMDPIASVLTFNLSACIEGCADDPRCLALNIQNSPNNDFCSYYHQAARLNNETSTGDIEDLNIYYLEKACFQGACSRLFAFELVTGKDFVSAPNSIVRNLTEKACLQTCLSQVDPPCLSVSYDHLAGDCSLRSVNRFTNPEDFQNTDRNVRHFDNNCHDELQANRSYEVTAKNLASHFSDTDYTGVSLSECANLCRTSPDYPCRAFFFGQTVLGQFCGLMHLNLEAVSRIPGGTFPVEGVNMYEPIKKPRECASDSVNFVLQSGLAITQEPIESSSLSNPSSCIARCKGNNKCSAVSVDYANAKCNYYYSYLSSDLTNDSMVNVYKKICLESNMQCPRDWAFERIEGQMLLTADKVIETFTARQCMISCLEEPRFQCRSFDFDSSNFKCRLSRLDRFSINLKLVDRRDFTVPSKQSDLAYYENNCNPEPNQFCFFESVKSIEIVSHDALVVDGIATEEDCKRACQQQAGFNCRRYTFLSSSLCMLTHYTVATAPPSSILHHDSDDSVYGEVVACYNVSVECGGVMTAHVSSNREYDGVIYAKGKFDTNDCGETVKQKFNFDLSLPLALRTVETCNTYSDEDGEFRNTIVLQHNAHVMTAMDQTFGLQCKYDLHAKEELTQMFNVTALLDSIPEATRQIIRHTVKMPQIVMKILGSDGGEITSAELGSELIVRIEMEDNEDVFGLSIRNMFAMDGQRKNNMTLIDFQGCPAENLIRNFRQLDPKTLQARMEVFAFPDDNQIIVEAEVQTCRHRCKPVICMNGAESYGKRKRRATEGETDEALARNTIRKTVTITSQKFTLPLAGDKSLKISVTGVSSIDSDGLICFLPHILAILTVAWFLSEIAAISTVCFLQKRISEIREKVRNAEGFYTYAPYVTYKTVPRKSKAILVSPAAESQGCSSC